MSISKSTTNSSEYKPKPSYGSYTTSSPVEKKAPPPPTKKKEAHTTSSPGVSGGIMQGFGWGSGAKIGRQTGDVVMEQKNGKNKDVVPQSQYYCYHLRRAWDICIIEEWDCSKYRALYLKGNCKTII